MGGASAIAAYHTNSSRTYCISPSESRGPGHSRSSIHPSGSAEPNFGTTKPGDFAWPQELRTSTVPWARRDLLTANTALMYDNLRAPGKVTRGAERKVLASEVWQFLMVVVGFSVVALFWLFVVYLPGRTLERWEDQRPGRGDRKTPTSAGLDNPDGPSTRPAVHRTLDYER